MSQDQIVDEWFIDTFHGQPLSTEMFNRFNAARDDLKRRLARAAPAVPESVPAPVDAAVVAADSLPEEK
jgi:hypothetical protein